MAGISITNIIKRYGSHTVLDFKEWKIDDGNYWIKGANGNGKTTLFKIIAEQTPFNGQVTINNITLNKTPAAYREMISYAAAGPWYSVFITGNELLNYHLAIRKADRKIVDKIVAQFKINAFMDNKIAP